MGTPLNFEFTTLVFLTKRCTYCLKIMSHRNAFCPPTMDGYEVSAKNMHFFPYSYSYNSTEVKRLRIIIFLNKNQNCIPSKIVAKMF